MVLTVGSVVHQGVAISVRGSVSSVGVKQIGSISFSLTLVDQVMSTINVGGGVSGVSNGVSVSGDWGSNMVGCGNSVSDWLSHNRLGISDCRGLVRDNLGGFNLNGFDNGGNGFDQGLVNVGHGVSTHVSIVLSGHMKTLGSLDGGSVLRDDSTVHVLDIASGSMSSEMVEAFGFGGNEGQDRGNNL